ncbi:MAG: FAD-dependent oxidoreductase [Thermoplasmata archaeon]|nr:FAD-dependent oxidoreductase [Thermoplasmata archaeon]
MEEAKEKMDVAIIGAGAAGLAAAIYAGRSGLSPVVFESKMVGGQTSLSPSIENYPGFKSISGSDLMTAFKNHAENYADIKEWAPVTKVVRQGNDFLLDAKGGPYLAKKIILATGAVHRKLNVPGEEELSGKGVSYCATCDGFFFKDRKILVIGGGNTALAEAAYLLDTGVKEASLAHRRDKLRGEKFLEDIFKKKGGKVLWNTVATSFNGEDRLSSVTLKNVDDGTESTMEVDGVFVAVGITPSNELAQSLGVNMDDGGYIIVDLEQRTNVPGVYAVGDNSVGLRQVVTGAGAGAVAAISAHSDITKQEWEQ